MEFTIEKEELVKGVFLAQGVADKRATMPVLANILLKAEGGQLQISATDLNLTVTTKLACEVAKEGALTISAKHLYEMIKTLPSTITIKRAANDYAEVSSAKVQYKIVGLPDKDFPKLPSIDDVPFASFEVSVLNDLIKKTFFSISHDETRYHLNGCLFFVDGGIARMVSTDGHRLSLCDHPIETKLQVKPGVLIPRRGLIEIRKLIDSYTESSIELGFSHGHLFVRTGATVLSVKLNEAQFPPYEQVIPKEKNKSVIVSTPLLLEALKRVSLMAPDKTCGVKFGISKGAIKIEADNPELGQAREELSAQYSGKDLSIGFNAKYLIDVISEIDTASVQFDLNAELDPGVIRPVFDKEKEGNQYLGVVMPMKL